MANPLHAAGTNLLATILGLDPKIVVGSTISLAIRKLLDHRQQVALDILLEGIAAGRINPADVPPDSLAAPVYRYLRSAREGAARLNLRLLARLIAGQAENGHLIADEFLYYADMIETLRREEIVLIAHLYQDMQRERIAPTIPTMTWEQKTAALLPYPFRTNQDVVAVAHAASRTGILIPHDGWGNAYLISPLGEKIIAMTSFEAALEQEPSK
jgi:hypothetical protein